jgi:hypothetical protein
MDDGQKLVEMSYDEHRGQNVDVEEFSEGLRSTLHCLGNALYFERIFLELVAKRRIPERVADDKGEQGEERAG